MFCFVSLPLFRFCFICSSTGEYKLNIWIHSFTCKHMHKINTRACMHIFYPNCFFFLRKYSTEREAQIEREREYVIRFLWVFNKMEICLEKKCMNKMCVCMHTSCNVDVYVLVVKIAQCAIGNWVLKPLQKFRNSLIS